MATAYAAAKSFLRDLSSLAHRNDFATTHPGNLSASEVSALSVGSGSLAIGKIELVSTQRAHQQDRAIDAELRRLYDSYITNAPTSNTPPIRETRFNYFGHTTAYADNKQGECAWNVFPTLPLDYLDESLLQFFDVPTLGLQPYMGSRFAYLDQHLIMRNQNDSKAEVDVWLLWPKEDVPTIPF